VQHVHEAIVLCAQRWYGRGARLAVAPLGLAVAAAFVAGCRGDDGSAADLASLEAMPWVLTAGVADGTRVVSFARS